MLKVAVQKRARYLRARARQVLWTLELTRKACLVSDRGARQVRSLRARDEKAFDDVGAIQEKAP